MNLKRVCTVVLILILAQTVLFSLTREVSNRSLPKSGSKATISVTDMTGGVTAANLVDNILGGGLTTSNIVYTGADVAAGTFTGGTAAGIGISEGIILSSGAALNALGPNDGDNTSADNGLSGDADIAALVDGATNDACILEFDFIPTTANFQFTFVMGSEEYEEYVNYADGFGFFLNGVNIALIPGTSTPISIGTINQNVNQAYYISNYPAPGTYDIECDGFTVPITLNATVTPNVVNHIKLAVADFSDSAYDTWVFISGNSVVSGYEVSVESTPTGASITIGGVDTGFTTPHTFLQEAGTTAVYTVVIPGYSWAPESVTVANISAGQELEFTGSAVLVITPEDTETVIGALDLPGGLVITDPTMDAFFATYPVFGSQTVTIPVGAGTWWGYIYYTGAWHNADVFPVDGPGNVVFSNVPFSGGKENLPIILDYEEEPLPVELSTFAATLDAQNFVNVQWTTQTETGLSGFYIYRGLSEDASQAALITSMIEPTNTSGQHQYSHIDNTLQNDGVYYYWLQIAELDGSSVFHGPITVNYTQQTDQPQAPAITPVTGIKSIYPNPITPYTVISYQVLKGADVKFQVFNARGQLVNSFTEGYKPEGSWKTLWNGNDANGVACPSGIYFIKMLAGSENSIRRVIIQK